jgi:hypothetical protein
MSFRDEMMANLDAASFARLRLGFTPDPMREELLNANDRQVT